MTTILETTTRIESQITASRAWPVFRIVIGLVLLTAAIAKCHALATSIDVKPGILHSRWFNILVVHFEIAFAVILFSQLLPKLTWGASLLTFAIFFSVAATKAALGENSCGCFGAAVVSPVWTAIGDLAVIGMLVVVRPHGSVFHWRAFLHELGELRRYKRVGVVAGAWLLLAVPMTFAMFSVAKSDIADLGIEFIGADGRKTILLQPENWSGKPLPLIPYIEPPEVREKLKTGEWTVVLYHHDCPKCKEVIDEYIAKLRISELPQFSKQLFVVNVDRFFRSQNDYFSMPEQCLSSNLSTDLIWVIETPCEIELNRGIVSGILP